MQRNRYRFTKLLPVIGETLNNQTANTSNEAKVDIKSRGFWVRGREAFFDVRVFEPKVNRYLNKALPQFYIQMKRKRNDNSVKEF